MQSPDAAVREWAKDNNRIILHSGAHAANVLGLSTQVPAHMVYYTDGETETRKIGPWNIEFVHQEEQVMGLRGNMASLIMLALSSIGPDHITPLMIGKIRSILIPEDINDLEYNMRMIPPWMKAVVKNIVQPP